MKNSDLTSETATYVETGFFKGQLHFRKIGNIVHVRIQSVPNWSFSTSQILISSFPDGFESKYDSISVLYESGRPVGSVYAISDGNDLLDPGIYIAGKESIEGAYYEFHLSYVAK